MAQMEGVYYIPVVAGRVLNFLVIVSQSVSAVDISDDEESPRARKHKKKLKGEKALPSWTNKKKITAMCVSDYYFLMPTHRPGYIQLVVGGRERQ